MPGTILVSVLELVDLPSATSASGDLISFKVAMGKREYQTKGREDFSFPVLSLRENMVLMLYDADGTEISRAVIKTMLVVENGYWDAWFPLDSGGNAHLKFQFTLNEDERKRIHEKRESALKRKHTNLTSGRRHSFSGVFARDSTIEAASRPQEDVDVDRLQQVAPEASTTQMVSALPQKFQEHPAYFSNQSPTVSDLPLADACGPQRSLKGTNSRSRLLGSNHSENIGEPDIRPISASSKVGDDGIQSPRKKNDMENSPASKVKKMISAFENNSSQEKKDLRPQVDPITRVKLRKTESTGSLRGGLLGKNQPASNTSNQVNGKTLAGETIPRSFSAGMLSEMNVEQSPEYLNLLPRKEVKDQIRFDPSINEETLRENSMNEEEDEKKDVKNSYYPKLSVVENGNYIYDAQSAGIRSSVPEPFQTYQIVNSGESEGIDKSFSSLDAQDQTVFESVRVETVHKSCRDDFIESFAHGASSQNTEPCSSLTYQEQIVLDVVRKESLRRSCGDELVKSSMRGASRENDETCSSSDYQEQSALDVVRAESVGIMFRDEAIESSSCDTSGEMVNMVTETCLLWYPSIWIRRPCITTGAKQLIGILECDVSAGTHSMESTSMTLSSQLEHMEHGNLFDQILKDEVSCSLRKLNFGSFVAVLKAKGRVIEQAIRMTILVVACGTLILNAKTR